MKNIYSKIVRLGLSVFLFTNFCSYHLCLPSQKAPTPEAAALKQYKKDTKIADKTIVQAVAAYQKALADAEKSPDPATARKDALKQYKKNTKVADKTIVQAVATYTQQINAARGTFAAQQPAAGPKAALVAEEKEASPEQKLAAKEALKKLFTDVNAKEAPEAGWQTEAITAVDNLQAESNKSPKDEIRYAVPDLIVYAENLLLDKAFHDNAQNIPLTSRVEGLRNNKPTDKIATAIVNIAIAAQEKSDDLWKIMEIVIQVRDEAMRLLAEEEKKAAAAK